MQNKFQDGLRKDIISIKKSKNIYIFVDKMSSSGAVKKGIIPSKELAEELHKNYQLFGNLKARKYTHF